MIFCYIHKSLIFKQFSPFIYIYICMYSLFFIESAAVASSVEETSNPATKCKSLPFPRQESKEPQELDAKPDARNPSQVEDDDDPKGAAQLDTKPDARIPSQVENDDPKGAAQLDTKPDARVPSQVEGDEDPKGAAQLDTKPDARIPSQVEDSEELEFNSRSNASQVNKRIGHAISTDDDDDVFDSTGIETDNLKQFQVMSSSDFDQIPYSHQHLNMFKCCLV